MRSNPRRKELSPNVEATMYIIMGLSLVMITFLWVLKPFIPNMIFIIASLAGIVPAIVMLKYKSGECSDEEKANWAEAKLCTCKTMWLGLFGVWAITCLRAAIDEGAAEVLCYMIPCLAGIGFLHLGAIFKCFQYCDDEDDW